MPLKIHEIPPVEVLRKHFRIDEHWRLQRKSATYGWRLAGKIYDKTGYFIVCFKSKHYLAHRIIWTLHYGRPPVALIDHINGNRWDNRIENLREATHAQNRWNSKPVPGRTQRGRVFKALGGYRARVTANYNTYYSPAFDDKDFALFVAEEMAHRYHGEFANVHREAA